jgi:ABC-type molybdate transport system permease subunit
MLSLAIYNFVQLGKDAEAYTLLAIAVGLAFLFVWSSEWLLRSGKKRLDVLLH